MSQPDDRASGLDITLMAWADTMNNRYSVAEVTRVQTYICSDILGLRACYGIPDGTPELWGDWRDNMLFGKASSIRWTATKSSMAVVRMTASSATAATTPSLGMRAPTRSTVVSERTPSMSAAGIR